MSEVNDVLILFVCFNTLGHSEGISGLTISYLMSTITWASWDTREKGISLVASSHNTIPNPKTSDFSLNTGLAAVVSGAIHLTDPTFSLSTMINI